MSLEFKDIIEGQIRHHDTDEFRTEALHFADYGVFTKYTKSDNPQSPYIKYWREQRRRGIEGYHNGREYIPGYFYYYLNFCPIYKTVAVDTNKTVGKFDMVQADRIFDFPDFYDGDFDYFMYLDEAEKGGFQAGVLKARGQGYSYKNQSMMNRNYFLIPGSRSIAIADEKEYLIGDGIITKTWDTMAFIDQNTAWTKKRQYLDKPLEKRASFKALNNDGVWSESGFKSEIRGISLFGNAERARGKRFKLGLFEEAGKNKALLQAWQIALPSVMDGNNVFGLMVFFGTGGTEGADFQGLEEMFFKPKGYSIYPIVNKWSKLRNGKETAFFSPKCMNLKGFMDKDGNSDIAGAVDFILKERKKVEENATNPNVLLQNIAENCLTPEEAIMRTGGTLFPVNDLRIRLDEVEGDPKKYIDTEYHGSLTIDSDTGKVKWDIENTSMPIYSFPLVAKTSDLNNISGNIVIYEHPIVDSDGKVPWLRYIAGMDPYEHDESTTGSLGSLIIFDRFKDIIVFEYTGRPATSEMYYEITRRALMYYNCLCNFENNLIKGVLNYFEKFNTTYHLCDTPSCIADRIDDKGLLRRKKGSPGTTPINAFGRELIKTWLLGVRDYNTGQMNIHSLRCIPLIKELMYWNKDGNFDRVSAFGMCMILREELFKHDVKETKNEASYTNDPFWKRPFENKKNL